MSQRCAIYARVSTLDQNPDMQLRDLREHAERRGWIVAAEFVDHGISGAIASRPQLDKLMADARRRKFDVVLVWRFDRFARSSTHLLTALDEFRKLNLHFVSLHEAVDTSTPLGVMIFTVVAAIGQLEREIIRERVTAGLRRAKAVGIKLGRPAAQIDTAKLKELKRQGHSLRAIANALGVSKSTVSRMAGKLPVTS